MKYSNIIKDFKWSYSRITSFETCPYKFFLTYIMGEDGEDKFFTTYGSFIHSILEKYLSHELDKDDLVEYYLSNFKYEVKGRAPSLKVFESYFNNGINYLENINFPYLDPVEVESYTMFSIGKNKEFNGIIDCVAYDGEDLMIIDHKSHNLKPRTSSGNKKTDIELDEYLRQLYLYSIPIKKKYGSYPKYLVFNCFRNGEIIKEKFNEDKLKEVIKWASDLIDKIIENDEWNPKLDFFKCKYICEHSDTCEYAQMCSWD